MVCVSVWLGVVKVLYYDIVVCEFELLKRYYVLLKINSIRIAMNSLTLSAMG